MVPLNTKNDHIAEEKTNSANEDDWTADRKHPMHQVKVVTYLFREQLRFSRATKFSQAFKMLLCLNVRQ